VRPEQISKLNIALFDGLSEAEIQEIITQARLQKFEPKVVMCSPDEPAERLFLLIHGRIKYCRVTPRGEEILLRLATPGESFGLAALLPNPPNYLGSAESMSQSELIVWEHKVLIALPDRYLQQLTTNSLRIALSQLGSLVDRHSNLFDGSATNRIARVLVDLGRRSGTVHHKGIDVSITNEQLGSLADVSRFTVSRTLSKWTKASVISKSRESVRIHSPEALLSDARAQT